MSASREVRPDLWSAVACMEDDVRNVSRWAGIINHLSASEHQIESDDVWIVAHALRELGKRLQSDWNQALEMAAEAKRCA